jgi:hypothetical protein
VKSWLVKRFVSATPCLYNFSVCDAADVDECLSGSSCGPNSVCVNTNGSYTCACTPGYEQLAGKDAKVDGCTGIGGSKICVVVL